MSRLQPLRLVFLVWCTLCLVPSWARAASGSSDPGSYDQKLLFYGKLFSVIPPGVFVVLLVVNLLIYFAGLVIVAKICFDSRFIISKSLKCWAYTLVAFISNLVICGLFYLLCALLGAPTSAIIILALLDVVLFSIAVLILIPMNVFEGTFVRTVLFAVVNIFVVWPVCVLASGGIGKTMVGKQQEVAVEQLIDDLAKGKIKKDRDYVKDAESRRALEEQDVKAAGKANSALATAPFAEENETPQMRLAQEKAGLEARAEMLARQKAELKESNKLGLRRYEEEYAAYQKTLAEHNAKVKATQPAAPTKSASPR